MKPGREAHPATVSQRGSEPLQWQLRSGGPLQRPVGSVWALGAPAPARRGGSSTRSAPRSAVAGMSQRRPAHDPADGGDLEARGSGVLGARALNQPGEEEVAELLVVAVKLLRRLAMTARRGAGRRRSSGPGQAVAGSAPAQTRPRSYVASNSQRSATPTARSSLEGRRRSTSDRPRSHTGTGRWRGRGRASAACHGARMVAACPRRPICAASAGPRPSLAARCPLVRRRVAARVAQAPADLGADGPRAKRAAVLRMRWWYAWATCRCRSRVVQAIRQIRVDETLCAWRHPRPPASSPECGPSRTRCGAGCRARRSACSTRRRSVRSSRVRGRRRLGRNLAANGSRAQGW